jgi:Mg2+/Co2+ transporter CorB
VNISLSSMGTVFFVNHLMMKNNGAAISTAVITVVVLIFGEISPKSIAMDCSESFAMFSAPVIRVFMWLLTPVNFIFGGWKNLVSKIFKIDGDKKTSQEELLMFVSLFLFMMLTVILFLYILLK